jgi:hypothetical protein
VSGPLEITGVGYIQIEDLDAGTYTLEAASVGGSVAATALYYPGTLALPVVPSSSMSSTWSGSDLVLSWASPDTEPNWAAVDQLRIIVYDAGGRYILNARANPTDYQMTLTAALLSQLSSLGDTSSMSWEVQTRAYAADGRNTARGQSNTVPISDRSESAIIGRGVWSAGNSHEYVVVSLPEGTWDNAVADLNTLMPGYHLATITSQEASDFVSNLMTSLGEYGQYWLGGFQDPEEVIDDMGWTWVTSEPWDYTNWADGEPNGGPVENHITTYGFGEWNDEGSAIGSVNGYIAESPAAVE